MNYKKVWLWTYGFCIDLFFWYLFQLFISLLWLLIVSSIKPRLLFPYSGLVSWGLPFLQFDYMLSLFQCILCAFSILKMLDLYLLGQNCLHLTFKPYLSSETYSRKCGKLPNIVVHACKILQKKNVFVENVWPANSALFVYVSTHCVETVKWLEYNRYSHLTR